MTENEAKVFIENAKEKSKNVLAELLLLTPKVFAVKANELGEYYGNLENCKKEIESCEVAVQALEDVQKYREIEKELKERYHANVDIPLLMHHFIETVFEGEKHEGFCLLTNEDREAWEEYKSIGTVEECRAAMEKQKSFKPVTKKLVCGVGKCKCGVEFLDRKTNYCGNCGQKLDWSDEG